MNEGRKLDGQLVKNWMFKNRKTREWMAVQLDVSTSTIQNLFRGKCPKPETILALSELMNVPVESLFEGKPTKRSA